MFFKMAQKLPCIWATFVWKSVTKNIKKIAQSGHAEQ